MLKYERGGGKQTDGKYKLTTLLIVSSSCNITTNINIQNNRIDLIICIVQAHMRS